MNIWNPFKNCTFNTYSAKLKPLTDKAFWMLGQCQVNKASGCLTSPALLVPFPFHGFRPFKTSGLWSDFAKAKREGELPASDLEKSMLNIPNSASHEAFFTWTLN